jgi:dsRNA-specific ribonuclease
MDAPLVTQIRQDFFRHELEIILGAFENTDGKVIEVMPDIYLQQILGSELLLAQIETAFIHRSYNYERNYEALEAFGDAIVNAFTADRIAYGFPTMQDPEAISNMMAYYKSNAYLADCMLSTIPNIDTIILKGENVELATKIYGDVFEAFFRVIHKVCNSLHRGLGWLVLENLYTKFTVSHPMSIDKSKNNPKSVVHELFADGSVTETPPKGADFDSKVGLSVTIAPEALRLVFQQLEPTADPEYLREILNPKADNNTAVGMGNNRGIATTDAYTQLLKKLYKIGITPEAYERWKTQTDIKKYEDKIGNKGAINTARVRLDDEALFFNKKDDGEGNKVWSLVAKKPNGQLRLIGSVESSSNASEFYKAKAYLLDMYRQQAIR